MKYPEDDLDELRKLRDEALRFRSVDPLVNAYHRKSIEMAWQDISSTPSRAPLADDLLRVEVLGVAQVNSYVAGQISMAIQQATADMDIALRNPQALKRHTSLTGNLDAPVVQEGAAGNVLLFRAPAVTFDDDGISLGPQPGRTSAAFRELLNVLPENKADMQSFVSRLELWPALERQAVQTVSNMAIGTPEGVSLTLSTRDMDATSVLDTESATEVSEFLEGRQPSLSSENVSGILDGFRGTRRVFYLITDDGREIAGSVDTAMLPDVRRLAGERVDATLSVSRWVARNGHKGPKHYGLISVTPEVVPGGLF
ncbi:hypothetical protein [Mycolicibacterium sp. A43C]